MMFVCGRCGEEVEQEEQETAKSADYGFICDSCWRDVVEENIKKFNDKFEVDEDDNLF